jgi:hypothetical protein
MASNVGDYTIPKGYTPMIFAGYGTTCPIICVKLGRSVQTTKLVRTLGPAMDDVPVGSHGFFLMDGRTSALAVISACHQGDWLTLHNSGTELGAAKAATSSNRQGFAMAEKDNISGIAMIPAIILPWRM